MKYVLADVVTQAWSGSPATLKPLPAAGQFVVFVPDLWPDSVCWVVQLGPDGRQHGGFVDYLSQVQCLAYVDAAAGALRTAQMTTAPGTADMYRRKAAEVAMINSLGGTTTVILAALKLQTAAQQQANYPFLYTEMQASSLTDLVAARDKVTAAIAAGNVPLAAIELARRRAKIAIRAATTLAAMNAAATGAAWPS